jgi:hypothetical protein
MLTGKQMMGRERAMSRASAFFSFPGHLAFLRQAASELRDMAAHDPEIAEALRHIADQITAEADDLEGKAEGVCFA